VKLTTPLQSSAKVKNAWSYTFSPSIRLLIKHKDSYINYIPHH